MVLKANAPQRFWLFLILWVIGTVIAYTLSGMMFHFPSGFPPQNGSDFNASGLGGGLMAGTLTALLVGGIQTAILTIITSGAWRWMLASWAALVISHTIGDMLPDPMALPVVIAVGGVMLGVAQWLALRQSVPRSPSWIAVTAIAWAAAIWLGLRITPASADWQTGHLVVGITSGSLLGIATGALWAWWLKQKSAT